MAVFRIERNRDYTVMSNHHLRDTELSLKSKGLAALYNASVTMGSYYSALVQHDLAEGG